MIELLVVVSMITGALCWELVKYVTRERHPVTREQGEEALRELRMHYRDVRRKP